MTIDNDIFVDVEHQVYSVVSVAPNIAQSHVVSYKDTCKSTCTCIQSLPRTYWYIRCIWYIKLGL